MAIAPNPRPAAPTRAAPFYATGLRCRVCGEGYPLDPVHVCERCFGPLEVAYDDAALARDLTRERIAAGPPTLWRYKPLLPIATDRRSSDSASVSRPMRRYSTARLLYDDA